MNGAQALCKALEAEGVEIIFGYPGGAIMPVYDALLDSTLQHILCRHEQGAALAADGYARASGRLGVCMATSGPGATNLITGIANAYMDSVPMLAITGQVANPLIGTDAFQEVDVFGMTLPIVKHSFLVRDVNDLPRIVHEACQIAMSGRPGPVLIDIPKDVQNAICSAELAMPKAEKAAELDRAGIHQARALISSAQRPLLYVGGGVVLGNASQALRDFVETTQIPLVSTLKGLGAVSFEHPLNLGMLGMHGTKAANFAVQRCDLLIVVGARFDDRATGKLAAFAPNARVIHLDIDDAEFDKLRHAQISLRGDLKCLLPALAVPAHCDNWREQCLADRQAFAFRYDAPGTGIYAPGLLAALSQQADDNTYVSCDVGQHQMWVAQHYGFRAPRQHLSSGGLGTMGYGLPAAIGAQLACPEARVICVSGDGSFQMNLQELATINRYKLPVKIVLLDNQALGMVRQWQQLFFAGRYSEIDLSDNPDFVALAKAFGIPAVRIDSRSQQDEAIRLLLETEGPLLLHVAINPQENVWPLVAPGKANDDMMEGEGAWTT
ncbi:acetolactate synthase 2 catalytic subunit [Permianibacter sp. IMCC34836]|uniref:acetolactate synthase 2 catalytic subunit n=1 Tax=Permianibacter fluminis TaxID=2738515 RepID=UPI001551F2E7|nr:acetolactate synthase 2 catalytic subunit [Permianibacter fluminis]NQD39058.1 acetolactate synthase 2 catalytic subunit [Permianibacter fluminis]